MSQKLTLKSYSHTNEEYHNLHFLLGRLGLLINSALLDGYASWLPEFNKTRKKIIDRPFGEEIQMELMS